MHPSLQRMVQVAPVLRWFAAPTAWRRTSADLVAGVALAALLIPESMGYSGVAGVPAEVGLYAALGAALAYAMTGGTSILVVGPASAVAALSASIVAEMGGGIDPVTMTAALAMISGLLLVLAGALRLGWIVNFISKPVLHAFVAGLAISIIIGQLDGLVGVEVDGESAVAKLVDVVSSIDAWHGVSVAIGVGSLVLLFALERLVPRVPAALVVVVGGIALVAAFDLAADGVAVVGEIPTGLPDVGVPDLAGTTWWELVGGGAALLLVGFSEGYASVSSVVAKTGEEVDADQELIGAGTANVAAGLFGGMSVSGSLSKSAAAQAAGARSQMTNLVSALIVLATLLFLGPIFQDLPEPALAAIVIVAVHRSANPKRIFDLWYVNRTDLVAAAVTFTLVLVWEALPAMIVGVLISLAFLVRRASFSPVVELRRDDHQEFRQVEDSSSAGVPGIDGVALLRFDAPLLYANAGRLLQAARALLEGRTDVTRLVLDAEMIADIDSTGAEALVELDDELAGRGVELHLARVHRGAREQVARSRVADRFEGRVHGSLREAVERPERHGGGSSL